MAFNLIEIYKKKLQPTLSRLNVVEQARALPQFVESKIPGGFEGAKQRISQSKADDFVFNIPRLTQSLQKSPVVQNIKPLKKSIQAVDYGANRFGNYLQNTYYESLKDIPKALSGITNPKPIEFAGTKTTPNQSRALNVGRLGFDILGSIPDPSDLLFGSYNASKGALTKYGQGERDPMKLADAAIKSASLESTPGLGEALQAKGGLKDIANIAEFPIILGAGFASSRKSAKSSMKVALDNEKRIEELVGASKNWRILPQENQIGFIQNLREVGELVIPDVVNNKAFRKATSTDPDLWIKTTSRFLEEALTAAKNPDKLSNFGFQTKPLRRLDTKTPPISREIKDTVEHVVKSSDIPVTSKVHLFDYIRTPEPVLNKIGLGDEAKLLRKADEAYKASLKEEIPRITEWAKRVPQEGASQRIFKYLDGQDIKLEGEELKVANEIKTYLKQWADKLGLPEDKRIASYITHIFEQDFIKKEFDPEVAKLIENRIPGSVYDPFLEKRLGQLGYVEDTWKALEAYVKRATRKYNFDPALKRLQESSKDIPLENQKYIQNVASKINLRPSTVDNLLDNFIKSSPVGYKFGQRPTAYLTGKGRRWIYRATLGLNVGSAVRNLTQGVNTYAKLGEKYTLWGYTELASKMANKNLDELYRVGVLDDNIIQDRNFHAVKKAAEKVDEVLWTFFDMAEKINRGSAYFGAKRKALAKGVSEEEAIEYAKKIVRDTQFTFGKVDTPVALSGDITKTLFQFQSFGLKQAEFLGGMVRNKDIAGLARYTGASIAALYSIGNLIGMDWKEFIPFYQNFSEGKMPTPPIIQVGKSLAATPGLLSEDEQKQDNAKRELGKLAGLTIPAGTQIKKTIGGLKTVGKGISETAKGRVRSPVDQTATNYVRGALFGEYNLPEMQEYYDKKRKPLGESQSELVKSVSSSERKNTYGKIIATREENAADDEVKEQVRGDGQVRSSKRKVFYYDEESDEVKSIPLQRDLKLPKMSGNETIDKELLKDYKSTLTKKQGDVMDLYKLGYMSAEEASKWYNTLEAFKDQVSKRTKKSGGAKKAKYVPFNPPKAKSRTSSRPKLKLLGQESVKITAPSIN
jgi:hypothetical protein